MYTALKTNISPLYFLCFGALLALSGCFGGGYEYQEEGLDKVIKQHREEPNFTVLLYDMNYENGDYLHKYQLLIPEYSGQDTSFRDEITPWYEVSPSYFQKHEQNLGMEMAVKEDGVVDKNVAPAGYNQYVGNEKYGRWEQRSGGSFWEFYGKYALLSSVFNMATMPARYSYYDTWNDSYRGRRPYYGPNDYYGTRRYTSTSAGRNTTWGRQPSSFKQRVRQQVRQSSSRRTSRSSNRYSRSRSRSRSGGFGK